MKTGRLRHHGAEVFLVLVLIALLLLVFPASPGDGSPSMSEPTSNPPSEPTGGSGQPGQPGQPGGGSHSSSPPTGTLSFPDAEPSPARTTTRTRSTPRAPSDPGGPFVDQAPQTPPPSANLAAGPPPPDQGTGAPADTDPASDSKPKRSGPLDALAALLGLGGAATAASATRPPNPCLRLQGEFDKVMGQIAAHRNFLRAQMATARKDDPTGMKVEELEAQLKALDSGEGHLHDQARVLVDKMLAAGCQDKGEF